MIDIQIQLTPKKTEIIKSFIEFTMEELGIETTPRVIIQATRDGLETTAAYSPSGKWIKVYGTGRAMVDICRSIAHEAVHHKQNETGELEATLQQKGEIADIGEKIEDDANAIAGQLIKKFAKRKSKAIYESTSPVDVTKQQFVVFMNFIKKKTFTDYSEGKKCKFKIVDGNLVINKSHPKAVYVFLFYDLIENGKPDDIRHFNSKVQHILSYFSIKKPIVYTFPIEDKPETFDDEDTILFESVEKKPMSVDKFVKLFIDRCKKKGTVALRDLSFFGVYKRFQDEETEYMDKMTQALYDFIIEEQGGVTYTLHFKNGEVADLFDTGDAYDPQDDFADLLTYNKVPIKTGPLMWDDYIYDALNEKSREMLRRYSKVDHISSTYLQHEFPDLCHDIAHAYSKASDDYNLKASILYIIKSIRNIFDGCQIHKSTSGFDITMPLTFMLTSTTFRDKLKETIGTWVSVSTLKNPELNQMTSTSVIIDTLFREVGESSDGFFNTIKYFFEEWAGGDLPKFDTINGMGTGVDEDYFNQLVTSTIIKFFDERY